MLKGSLPCPRSMDHHHHSKAGVTWSVYVLKWCGIDWKKVCWYLKILHFCTSLWCLLNQFAVSILKPYVTANWGTWGRWSHCKEGEYVVGMQVKAESYQVKEKDLSSPRTTTMTTPASTRSDWSALTERCSLLLREWRARGEAGNM